MKKIGRALAASLVEEQFPEFSDLSVTPIDSGGTVNSIFRLGNDYTLRFPATDSAEAQLEKELEWLPF